VRRSVLFVHQHGKFLLVYLALCLVLGTIMAHPAGALVDAGIVEGVRKDVRELNLLNRQSTRSGGQDKPTGSPPARSAASSQTQSASATPNASSTSTKRENTGSINGVTPLPVVDTSPMSYPSLTVAAFRPAKAASAVSASSPMAKNTFASVAIEASPQGWYVAGVAWYWWLLSLLAVGLGIRRYVRWQKAVSLGGSGE
jgi:hypothetical protein